MEKDAKDAETVNAGSSTSTDPRLVYVPREDVTSQGEIAALANIYRFVIESHKRDKAAEIGNDGGRLVKSKGAAHKLAGRSWSPR
jgi:hypothetical protein